MGAEKKFLFETSFDADGGAHRGPTPAGGQAAARSYGEEELAAARQEAFAEGKTTGAREVEAAIEAMTARALAEIAERLPAAAQAASDSMAGLKRTAVGVATTLVRKAFPGLSEASRLREIESLVAECLEAVVDEPRVAVRVPDSLLDALKERIDPLAERCGFPGRVVLVADPNLAATDCRVEWADGGVERDSARLWNEIDGAVARFLAILDANAPAPPAMPPTTPPTMPPTTGPTMLPGAAPHPETIPATGVDRNQTANTE